MDIFTKNKLTAFTIVLLVIFNLTTLAIIWSNGIRPPVQPDGVPPVEQRPRSVMFLKNELGLTNEQVRDYRKLRLQHRANMRMLNEEILVLKRELLDQLFYDKVDEKKVEQLLNSIGERQRKVERLTFDHFNDLKKLCGEGQQEKLRRLFGELFRPHELPPEVGGETPRSQRPGVRPPREQF